MGRSCDKILFFLKKKLLSESPWYPERIFILALIKLLQGKCPLELNVILFLL
jgi:hypothetical protein